MSENLYPQYFDGKIGIEDTQRNCKVEQQNRFSILKNIELGQVTDDKGKQSNVNIATFDHVGIFKATDILNELKFIDISTPSGIADAAAALGKYTHMFDCKMFVADSRTDVSVFGRKNPNL